MAIPKKPNVQPTPLVSAIEALFDELYSLQKRVAKLERKKRK